MIRERAAALLLLMLLAGPGCDETERAAQPSGDDTTVARAPLVEAPPSDPDIAHILQTFNAITLRRATLATSRSQSAAVRAFADSITAGHAALNARTMGWLHALNLVPVDNSHSRILNSSSDDARSDLEQKIGADFDRSYVDHEVTFHQRMLELLDASLLPNANNVGLRNELQHARPALAAHLERARKLQQSFVTAP
ncbi:MAG: DUF4142 domain-containing protein [Gemmatimonadota bacterium]